MKETQDDIQNEIKLILFSITQDTRILNMFNHIQQPEVDYPLVPSNTSIKISCVPVVTLLFTTSGLNYDCHFFFISSSLVIIVSTYDMEHNLQTNFLYIFAIEPDPNPVRHAGFISPIRGEATKIFHNILTVPNLFWTLSFL